MKKHISCVFHSPQVYSWVWFQASVFHGKLSWKTSCMFKGEAASLLSIFHLCHSHRCLILCSMFLVFRAYLYKIASPWRWTGKKRLSTGLLQALRLLLTLQLPLGFVGQRQLGKLCIAQLAHLSRNASKNGHCFPGYVSFYWNWHRQLDLIFCSFHFIPRETSSIQQKTKTKIFIKHVRIVRNRGSSQKTHEKKNVFFPICHGPCLSLLSIWIFRVHLTHWSCVHIRSFDVMLLLDSRLVHLSF